MIINCPYCKGFGYTSEHDPSDPHEDGCSGGCPIQVQCEKCEATGKLNIKIDNNMEVTGKIKKIDETKTYGSSGFRKREMAITVPGDYPQHLLIEFVQDKCDLLDSYKVGQDVKIAINLNGRIWVNPEGVDVYFNSIQGWRIEKADGVSENPTTQSTEPTTNVIDDDLPF
jgi:exosome complex RNA-binding protein Rrp4